VVGKQGSVF